MRVIFAGTPEFARVALADLLAAGFEVPLVLTQPDRPAGRGLKLQPSPVKLLALAHGIPVAQPRSLRLDGKYPEDAIAAQIAIKPAAANAAVVAAYGLILPQWLLDLMHAPQGQPAPALGEAHEVASMGASFSAGPPQAETAPSGDSAAHGVASVGATTYGCFNIHASLLPRWRGAAPIHRAIEAGDTLTGITLMQMDAGLDTGDMLLIERVAMAADDTTGSLHDKLASLGGQLAVRALRMAADGELRPVAQPSSGITYAHKVDKAEAVIDWSQAADVIGRKIRAFNPFPGASTLLGSDIIKLWRAEPASDCFDSDSKQCTTGERYGTVLHVNEQAITVQTGQGALRLTELQRAGGKRLAAAEFLRGFALEPGQVLG